MLLQYGEPRGNALYLMESANGRHLLAWDCRDEIKIESLVGTAHEFPKTDLDKWITEFFMSFTDEFFDGQKALCLTGTHSTLPHILYGNALAISGVLETTFLLFLFWFSSNFVLVSKWSSSSRQIQCPDYKSHIILLTLTGPFSVWIQ
jgi:hypothetical protein